MILLFTAIILYLLYLFLEHRQNEAARRSFLHVIHVNGIRGKTGTCRTLDAVLRAKYKVFTKTTGTDAAVIDTEGREIPIRRIGPASIGEQIRILRRAHREGADILVIECMAVNPVLQKAAQEQIVKGDISVITNVRYDHILDMGETREEIAESLSAVIPDHGLLVTADPEAEQHFGDACRRKNTELISCPSDGDPYHFLNLFSVNDPESTEANFRKALKDFPEGTSPSGVCFLYHHRTDRPDRALLFARHFFPLHPDIPLYLCGPGLPLPKRLFAEAGVKDIRILPLPRTKRGYSDPGAALRFLPNLPEGTLLVGIGNIKGYAHTLIEQLNQGDTI